MVKLTLGTEVEIRLPDNTVRTGSIQESRGGRIKVRLSDGSIVSATKEDVLGHNAQDMLMDDEMPLIQEALPAHYQVVDPGNPDEEASAFVINDEWYGQIEQANPFDEAAAPYQKANPGRKFRFLGEMTVKRHGTRGYVPVLDKATGKPIVVSGMTLASIPMHVHKERARRVQAETDSQAGNRQQPIADEVNEAYRQVGVGSGILSVEEMIQTRSHGISGDEIRKESSKLSIK